MGHLIFKLVPRVLHGSSHLWIKGYILCGSRGPSSVDQRVRHLWIKGVHHLWIKGSLICGSWGPSSVDQGSFLSPQASSSSGILPLRHPSLQASFPSGPWLGLASRASLLQLVLTSSLE